MYTQILLFKSTAQGTGFSYWPVFLGFLLFTVIFPLRAQENLKYQGTYQVGEYVGAADFEYRIANGDTIFNGPFRMEKSNLGALLEAGDVSFSFSGAFQEDVPTGAWQFRFGEFQTDSLTEVEGYQYNLKVSGTQHEAIGVIRNGRPDGLWTHTLSQIRNSQLEKILFRSSIRFDQGVPQKTVRIESNGYTLVGRVLRNGLAHDQWTLYSELAGPIENWYFREGLLLRKEVLANEEFFEYRIFDEKTERVQAIALDSSYIAILDWQLYPDEVNSELAALLLENHKRYKDIDRILNELGQAAFKPGFQVLAHVYPLDAETKEVWSSLATGIREAEALNRRILEDPQLQIARRSDAEAQFLYEVSQSINDRFTEPLRRIPQLEENGILEYVDRSEILNRLWPQGLPEMRVTIDGEPAQSFPDAAEPTPQIQGSGPEALGQLADYTTAMLTEIQDRLGPRLAQQKQQREQAALEEGLIAQLDELNSTGDSLDLEDDPDIRPAIAAIQAEGERLVSEYSNLPATADKTARAKEIAECLDLFNELTRELKALPAHWEEIRKAYTDQIWNPFTATIMDESVKRRITGAYQDVLIPYLLEDIRLDPDCDKAPGRIELLKAAPARVLELRDEDTSKLERKLRREKDPQNVIALFDLNPGSNDE